MAEWSVGGVLFYSIIRGVEKGLGAPLDPKNWRDWREIMYTSKPVVRTGMNIECVGHETGVMTVFNDIDDDAGGREVCMV